METFKLNRSGKSPLKFNGELITESSSSGHNSTRWHEVSVYKTDSKKWVVAVEFVSRWQGEMSKDTVEYFDNPQDIAEYLEKFDCFDGLLGFPASEHYADKQAKLEKDIKTRWDALVSEILSEIPGSEEVI